MACSPAARSLPPNSRERGINSIRAVGIKMGPTGYYFHPGINPSHPTHQEAHNHIWGNGENMGERPASLIIIPIKPLLT